MTQDDECRLDSTWVTICNELQQVISTEAVACWFRPLKVKRFDNQVLTLYHDQSIYSYWIEENYLRQLTTIASNVLGAPINIVFKLLC
jgi:chromosomal replication initiation ATPase DnaA